MGGKMSAEYHHAYYLAHKEEWAAKTKAWREAHPGEHARHNREERAAHPERRAIECRKRYESRKDVVKASNRRWRVTHKDHVNAITKAYQSRKAATVCDFTYQEWVEVQEEFNHCCAYCGLPASPMTMDHMTPLSRGGQHTRTNIVPACVSCNARKHDKTLLEVVHLATSWWKGSAHAKL
jgi:5-methylcytosine-specific restriction endonuclease McrA